MSITSPAYGVLLNRNPVTVTGTVDDATAAVTVNGVLAAVKNGAFTTHVILNEQGSNALVATAVDRAGNRSSDTIMVTLDTLGPDISISRPPNGWMTRVAVVTVAGRIADAGDVTDVRLNGSPLAMDRSEFSIGVPLVEGKNVITVSAGDGAGNSRSTSITVNFSGPRPVVVVPANPRPSNDDAVYEERRGARGALTGRVTFTGTPPGPKTFAFDHSPNPTFCSKTDSDGIGNRLVQEVNVGKDHALKDVVISIEDVPNGKPFTFEGTRVKAEGCRFLVQDGPSAFAGGVVKKKDIQIENLDADPTDPKAVSGVPHNPHAYEVAGASNSTIFNLPLPEKGQIVRKPVVLRKKGSIFKLECDQHTFMQAFFVPVSNPYYAIAADDGTFTIDDIPPGTYEVSAWHPTLGKQGVQVTIRPRVSATADFSFAEK